MVAVSGSAFAPTVFVLRKLLISLALAQSVSSMSPVPPHAVRAGDEHAKPLEGAHHLHEVVMELVIGQPAAPQRGRAGP